MTSTQTSDPVLESGGYDEELGLVVSPPQPLPFAAALHIRSFVLPREGGNILVYSTGTTDGRAASVTDRGGIARHYLNHGHEAMFPAERVDAPLFLHEADRRPADKAFDVRGTFDRRHTLDDDFEVIPIPGHTPGATAYLWDNGAHRMLFTGDSLYLERGEWVAAVLDSSDRESYVESLELLRELEFDVLVPWAASAGEPFHAATNPEDARARIGEVLVRVRSGTN